MDPNEESLGSHAWLVFVRMFLGAFWLYEITLGKHWKVGFPGAGPRPGWIGAEAGALMTHYAQRAIVQGVDPWFATILESFVLPAAPAWGWLVTITQAGIGLGLLVGFRTRWFAAAGVALGLALAYLGSIRSGALVVGHGALLLGGAGRYVSVDGWLRSRGLPSYDLPALPRSSYPPLASVGGVVAIYYVFRISAETATRQVLKSLELSMLFALAAIALLMRHRGADRLPLAGDVLRLYVGWAFLHETFVRGTGGGTSLPGSVSGPALHAVFEQLSAAHLPLVARVIEAVFSPFSVYWAAVFGAVQLVIGVALLAGWRVRRASLLGLGYLGLLVALGYIKVAPYFFAYLVGVYGLGGRYVSLDGRSRPVSLPAFPEFGAAQVGALGLVSLGLAAIALRIGVYPGARGEALDVVVPVYVAIFVAILAAVGRRRTGEAP